MLLSTPPVCLLLQSKEKGKHQRERDTQVAIPQPPNSAGDTFTKTFEIKGIRNTSDKERSTYDFTCRLVNQRGKVCMECDRTTLFPFFAPPSLSKMPPPEPEKAPKSADRLRDHVVKQSEKLGEPSMYFRLPPLARVSGWFISQ